MSQHLEGWPHSAGVDLHPAAYDLHGTDVGEAPLAEPVDGLLELVGVGDVDADPASVAEVGEEVVVGVLDVGHVGGEHIGIVELDGHLAGIADLIRPVLVETHALHVLQGLLGVLLLELHGVDVSGGGDGAEKGGGESAGTGPDLDDAGTGPDVAFHDDGAGVLGGDDLGTAVQGLDELDDAGAEDE